MTSDKKGTNMSTCMLHRTGHSFVLVAVSLLSLLAILPPQQPSCASALSLLPQTHTASLLFRTRRDENEGVGARHRTTSVGFYIGDPCKQTCSSVLHHVFCNHTSRRCECRPEHPVNINNRQCVKASSLGSHCAYHEVCVYYVAHSSCQSNKCRCIDGHEPDTESKKCTPKRAPAVLDGTELTTMVSVIVALLLFMALFCLVLRLFSKARFGPSSGDRMADAGSPPPSAAVLSSVDGSLSDNGTAAGAKEGPGSRRKSRNSIDVTGPRRPGNTVPASAETRNMMF
ncbi:uncharacterized protein LOC119456853 [Dermacentor silvarum]|uniref:uncharacterized protein LOC119456853 n=1 Tax=Dermacentor silvarum TaxID=543639 RepID=UPI002101C728|nr:uncharacterized protein LOC119456853 [Dermacentor silvarum]